MAGGAGGAFGSIVFTTRTLGGATGVSQAALDIALALSQRARLLRIRAWVPTVLPRAVDARRLGACTWEPVSPLTAAKGLSTGEAPPRALFEHARGIGSWARSQLVPRERPALEIVNGLGAHALFAAERALQRESARAPSALIVHESPRHFEGQRQRDLAQAMRAYDYRVFVSERGRSEWEGLSGLDPSRSVYIPNCVRERRVLGVFATARADLRKRFGYDGQPLQVVCVGQVTPRKGQDVVLEALRALPSGTRPVHVDFLGEHDSRWARQLTSQLRGSKLAANVRFLGKVTDVYERVYAADVLVLGSRAEASPLVVLEAMALGVCVVASDVDGVGEQIVDEESGLLFTCENARELAGCLARVARDGRLRERLGAAGRARYLERYSRDRQLARWSSALQWMQKLATAP